MARTSTTSKRMGPVLRLGDPIEVRALGRVLGEGRDPTRPLLIGSVKTNIGHLESAAGVAGFIKVVLSLRREAIPKHLNFNHPNPFIEWANLPVAVVDETKSWPPGARPRRAGVSSFGFSGTNAAPQDEAEAVAAMGRKFAKSQPRPGAASRSAGCKAFAGGPAPRPPVPVRRHGRVA